jgi:hypothetical protein
MRWPRLRAGRFTALDWPNVLAVAAEDARGAGVADRHVLRPGIAFDADRAARTTSCS